jgi:cell division protein ZapA
MSNQVPFAENQPASSLGMGSINSLNSFQGVDPSQGNDALIEQLAQRQQTFSQLGNFMTAIQNEAQSVELWKTKLKELETLTNERQSLKKELTRAQEESISTSKTNTALTNQLSQLKNELAIANSQLKTEKLSKQQSQDECNRLLEMVAKLEESSKQGEREAKAAATLSMTNAELNQELGNMKALLDRTNNEAARVVSEAQNRYNIAEKEKQDLGRHFANVMEDVKVMKEALVSSQNQCVDLETRLAGLQKDNQEKDRQYNDNESTNLMKIKQLQEIQFELEKSRDKAEASLMLMRDQGIDSPMLC